VRGDAGALLTERLLGDLDDNLLTLLEQVGDGGNRRALAFGPGTGGLTRLLFGLRGTFRLGRTLSFRTSALNFAGLTFARLTFAGFARLPFAGLAFPSLAAITAAASATHAPRNTMLKTRSLLAELSRETGGNTGGLGTFGFADRLSQFAAFDHLSLVRALDAFEALGIFGTGSGFFGELSRLITLARFLGLIESGVDGAGRRRSFHGLGDDLDGFNRNLSDWLVQHFSHSFGRRFGRGVDSGGAGRLWFLYFRFRYGFGSGDRFRIVGDGTFVEGRLLLRSGWLYGRRRRTAAIFRQRLAGQNQNVIDFSGG
jgi:hypothetical protein